MNIFKKIWEKIVIIARKIKSKNEYRKKHKILHEVNTWLENKRKKENP